MNENLLQKYQNGELTDEQIIAADLAAKRAEYSAETNRRAEARRAEENAEKARRQRFEQMASLDRQCDSATRDLESSFQKVDDLLLPLAFELVRNKARIISAQRDFSSALKKEIPRLDYLHNHNAPELENQLSETLEMLKTQFGASLSSVCSDIWQPHLRYAPPFCRNGAYDQPETVFGSLVHQIEKMIMGRLAAMPEDEPTEPARQESANPADLKIWAFARAAAVENGIDQPPPLEKAA
jgi:hypothetical protein